MAIFGDLLGSPLLWTTFVGLAIVWLGQKVSGRYRLYKQLSVLPQEKDFSLLLGTIHKFPPPEDSKGFMKYITGLLGISTRMFLVWITPLRPFLILYHPEPAKIILQSSEPKPLATGDAFRLIKPWLGEGLVLSNGDHWYRARRLLTPAFHFDILRPYVEVYSAAADIMLEKIGEFADKGESFDIYPMLKLCTFDIILKCAMSVDLDVQRKTDGVEYMHSVDRLAFLWGRRLLNVLLHPDFIYFNMTSQGSEFKKQCDHVHHFAEDIISRRREILEKEGPPKKRYQDFVDILLMAKDDSGKGLTSEEIRSEVDTFLFAGHETSSTALSWLFYLLSTHPDQQQRAREEVDAVLSDRDSKEIHWSDLAKLDHLQCCAKEALRLYPPAPGIARILTKDTPIDGVTIPAGTRVSVNMYLLHRNPEVFDKPDDFVPERFRQKEGEKNPFAYVPFSAGPRNCIGQNFALNEIKAIAAKVLSKFELQHDSEHPISLSTNPITHSETGIWLKAKRRE